MEPDLETVAKKAETVETVRKERIICICLIFFLISYGFHSSHTKYTSFHNGSHSFHNALSYEF